MKNRIERLYEGIRSCQGADPASSGTARLLCRGHQKKAKKLGEEAVEAVIAYLKKDRPGLVGESVDLLYHLAILWADLGIAPSEIWAEMDRRSALRGLAEKLPRMAKSHRSEKLNRAQSSAA